MAAAEGKYLTPENVPKFVDSMDTFLFDCDGVLWTGNHVLPGAVEFIKKLQEMGKRVCYVTNNSSKSHAAYLKKCEQLGFPAKEDDIYCTSYIAAYYLKNVLQFSGKVFLVGNPGIKEEFDKAGLSYICTPDDPVRLDNFADLANFKKDPEVGAVVAAFDPSYGYRTVAMVANYLTDENCLFIATNTDDRFPTGNGKVLPGTGVLIKCLETASRRKPTVLGKPEETMYKCITNKLHLDPSRTCMVGDRLSTDILMGRRQGLCTLLLFSGVDQLEDLEKLRTENKPSELPHYFLNGLYELSDALES